MTLRSDHGVARHRRMAWRTPLRKRLRDAKAALNPSIRLLDTVAVIRYAGSVRITQGITFDTVNCSLTISRPAEGSVLLTFKGSDVGEFGDAPFKELSKDLAAHRMIELFVDAADCSGATIDVSSEWARWMSENRTRLTALHLLCGSRFIKLTAEFVRRFTGFEERMWIYTERAPFDEALARSTGR
jgi:hypothetical protein